MSLIQGVVSRAVDPATMPVMALSGGTYVYPFMGILYFIRNPILWGNLIGMVVPQMILTGCVLSFAYLLLYPPQASVAIFFNGPVGVVTSWIAVMQQSLAMTMALSEMWLMPEPLRNLFDAIMARQGYDSLVLAGRMRQSAEENYNQQIRGFMKGLPRSVVLPTWAMRILFRVSLTFIPIVGPMIGILVNATSVGRRCQERYFELKGFSTPEVENYVRNRRGQLFAFGVVAATLEAIPIVGLFFVFTNTAGGALWAADSESRIKKAVTKQKKTRLRYVIPRAAGAAVSSAANAAVSSAANAAVSSAAAAAMNSAKVAAMTSVG